MFAAANVGVSTLESIVMLTLGRRLGLGSAPLIKHHLCCMQHILFFGLLKYTFQANSKPYFLLLTNK